MNTIRGILVVVVGLSALADRAAAADVPKIETEGVVLRFDGARAFTASQLAEVVEREIREYRRSGFELIYADDAADHLRRFYLTEGHARADVEYVPRAPDKRGVVTFRIREGPRLVLGEVRFEGQEHLPAEVLAKFVRRRKGLFGSAVLVEERLASNLRSIETYYAQLGFLAARAGPPRLHETGDEDSATVDLTVPIVEGPRTWIRLEDVTLTGPRLLGDEAVLAAVADGLKLPDPVGRVPYQRTLPFVVRSAVLERYGERGFPFTEVHVGRQEPEGGGYARLDVEVEEGRKARIVAIDVEGNVVVPTHLVRNEFRLDREIGWRKGGTLDVGDEYDLRRVRNAQLALQRTGWFRSVRIESLPVPDEPRQVILRVLVRERQHRSLDLSVGWGSYDLLRVGASFGNVAWNGIGETLGLTWGGHALQVRVTGDVSARGGSLAAQIRDRRFLLSRVEAVLEAGLDERQNVSFSFRRGRIQLGLGRRLPEVNASLRTEAAYTFQVTDVLDADDAVDAEEQTTRQSSVALGLVGDWRRPDDRVWPTRDGVFAVRYEFATRALGGEIDFHRATVDASYHIPFDVDREWVLSGRLRAGLITPWGDTDEIPIEERFFNGGGTTVRSFREQELGPRRNGSPVGGETFTTWNLEMRVPLYSPYVYGAAFLDAGNVRRETGDGFLGNMHYGLGGGLRLRTPVGPIRFDAGWNPEPRPDDTTWAFHVSLGFVF